MSSHVLKLTSSEGFVSMLRFKPLSLQQIYNKIPVANKGFALLWQSKAGRLADVLYAMLKCLAKWQLNILLQSALCFYVI
jgi:hypothetical protein